MKNKDNSYFEEEVPKVGDIINVQAFKYDGTLYRQWNGVKVIEVSPFHIVVIMIKTKVTEGNSRKWIIREPTLWFFPLESNFFNASVLLRDKGDFLYINLASPPLFEDNTIKFIDFDLDIKTSPNQNYSLVDQNEFQRNSIKYNYSEDLIKLIKKSAKLIKIYYKDKDYIFNKDYINTYVDELKEWRLIRNNFRSKKRKKLIL